MAKDLNHARKASPTLFVERRGKARRGTDQSAAETESLKRETEDLRSLRSALDKSQAVIEFSLDGIVANANTNFLSLLGYTLEEVQGKHHSMFVEVSYRNSPEYAEFWSKLKRGEFFSAEYKRIGNVTSGLPGDQKQRSSGDRVTT
jgi:PAS domain-containing protein